MWFYAILWFFFYNLCFYALFQCSNKYPLLSSVYSLITFFVGSLYFWLIKVILDENGLLAARKKVEELEKELKATRCINRILRNKVKKVENK